MPDDFKERSYMLDGISGEPDKLGLKQSAAIVCDPPVLCGYGDGNAGNS